MRPFSSGKIMKINTSVNVGLYAVALDIPYEVHKFDNLNDAVAFQQSAIKSKSISKVMLQLISEKESEAENVTT
jgi:hypothetical protein